VGGTSTLPAFPQFLGPDRTGILSGPALDRDWTSRPPRLLWLRPVGAAWSGFAVSEGRAVTQEQDGENELVTCYELFTGRRLWSHSYAARYFTTIAGEGPRATPTLANGRVYTLGATGVLTCLELESGRALWSRNIAVENGANVPEWGLSGSPLVDGDRVVVSAGGPNGKSLVAYRIEGGAPLWSGGDDEAGYGSPALALLAGRQQILAFNRRRITAHDADAGRVLWEYPWGRGFPHVAVPVAVSSNTVLFSSGYGVGSELLRIDVRADGSMAAERVWKSIRMKAKFNNPLAYRGHLYGLDDGVLACIDLADGSQKWKEGRYGHGQVLLVGETLLVTSETGEILLVDPTPEAHRVLARHRVFQRKTWNPPALVGKVLLVRNDAEAACLELPLAR
jgi:outer membrane protein assembly factor BamB